MRAERTPNFNSSNLWEEEGTILKGPQLRAYRFGESNRGVLVEWIGPVRHANELFVSELTWLADCPDWVRVPKFPFLSDTWRHMFKTVDSVNAILDKAAQFYSGDPRLHSSNRAIGRISMIITCYECNTDFSVPEDVSLDENLCPRCVAFRNTRPRILATRPARRVGTTRGT